LQNHKKVIPFIQSEPSEWTFWDFVHPSGNNPIEDWYQGLSDAGRLLFDGLLKTNYKTKLPIHWIGVKRFLKGKPGEQQIWELQFYDKSRKLTYRVLGTFGSERKQAIILIGCYHKDSVYDPQGCIETATDRAKKVARKEVKPVERKIKTDI
jgi:hypothetical protein